MKRLLVCTVAKEPLEINCGERKNSRWTVSNQLRLRSKSTLLKVINPSAEHWDYCVQI
jgi:hypothetical protein